MSSSYRFRVEFGRRNRHALARFNDMNALPFESLFKGIFRGNRIFFLRCMQIPKSYIKVEVDRIRKSSRFYD